MPMSRAFFSAALQKPVILVSVLIPSGSATTDERNRVPGPEKRCPLDVEVEGERHGRPHRDVAAVLQRRARLVRVQQLPAAPGRGLLDRVPGVSALDGLTFTATGRNLLTWSDYDGYDPDVGRSGGGTGSAAIARVDGFSYPNFRQLTLGEPIR